MSGSIGGRGHHLVYQNLLASLTYDPRLHADAVSRMTVHTVLIMGAYNMMPAYPLVHSILYDVSTGP